jgi:hypothetical protein
MQFTVRETSSATIRSMKNRTAWLWAGVTLIVLVPTIVSAGPARTTFGDVPFDHWAWRPIDSLAAAGVTSGCQAAPFPRFCPTGKVNRAQMAVFLLRAKWGAAFRPPAATGTVFVDVPQSYWAAAWIEEIWREGITAGCSPDRYCPSSRVTRAQMAVLMLRTMHGAAYTPPPASGTVFSDVLLTHGAAAWIEEFAREGVTAGCGGGRYCPTGLVSRAQMAVFLVTAFALPLVDEPIAPTLAACTVFPENNIWSARVDSLPVDPRSNAYVQSIGLNTGLYADFGSGTWNGGPIGIPFAIVEGTQRRVGVTFDYDDESDPGPYPIPPGVPIEGGASSYGDRHVLVLDSDRCRLYETWDSWPQADGSWRAGSGAVFNLGSNALRPDGWTSADAAGLPVLPGLVRYEEVASGEIRHAIRFTASRTRRAYVWPARHYASSSTDPTLPPMGQRFRLKSSFDVTPYPASIRVLLVAMKRYGLILADNGSSWYISGAPDERWDNDLLRWLDSVRGADFEAVDSSGLMVHPDSGATN